MNKLVNLDDLENSSSHTTTLQHAAEISPYITERTLGSIDEVPIKVKPAELNVKIDKKLSSKQQNNLRKSPPTPHRTECIGILTNLNVATISTSVLLHEAEQTRSRLVRKHGLNMAVTKNVLPRRLSTTNQSCGVPKLEWSDLLMQAEKQTNVQMDGFEKRIEEIRKNSKSKIKSLVFNTVTKSQAKFREKYKVVSQLLTCNNNTVIKSRGDYNDQLKELVRLFEELLISIQAGNCDPKEMNTAQTLCDYLDALEANILADLEMYNLSKQTEDAERAKAQEECRTQLEVVQEQKPCSPEIPLQQTSEKDIHNSEISQVDSAQQLPNVTNSKSESVRQTNSTQIVNAERLQFYNHIIQFYQEKVDKVKPLQIDDNMKKYRFACQKVINIPVNAISGVNREHLQDKFEKLYNFISGQPVTSGDCRVSVNDHPLGRDYCLLLMAKKFVSQGDTAISSNPQAAFPVASVIISLWKLIPEFGLIFLAYIFKESPFLVPYLIPQKAGQSAEDYYKILGYRLDNNGIVEQQDMYLKRQAGIARLYGAVMITNGRQIDGPNHPHGIDNGWRWFTNFIVLTPLPEITATLLLEMLQVVGADMLAAYNKQFIKLLLYIQTEYFPLLNSEEGGPKARLELLLAKCLRECQIQRPIGILPFNFW